MFFGFMYPKPFIGQGNSSRLIEEGAVRAEKYRGADAAGKLRKRLAGCRKLLLAHIGRKVRPCSLFQVCFRIIDGFIHNGMIGSRVIAFRQIRVRVGGTSIFALARRPLVIAAVPPVVLLISPLRFDGDTQIRENPIPLNPAPNDIGIVENELI